jgi:hypothetical protein
MNADVPIDVTELGMMIEERLLQPLNASYPIDVRPVKYRNTSNDRMSVSPRNTVSMSVTKAASYSDSSPSPSLSQFCKHIDFTFASLMAIVFFGLYAGDFRFTETSSSNVCAVIVISHNRSKTKNNTFFVIVVLL